MVLLKVLKKAKTRVLKKVDPMALQRGCSRGQHLAMPMVTTMEDQLDLQMARQMARQKDHWKE